MYKDPFEEIKRFRKERNSLFDTFWSPSEISEKALPDRRTGMQLFREPLSGLKETVKELVANIELSGVDKNDIQLQITENNLEVKVEKKQEVLEVVIQKTEKKKLKKAKIQVD